MNIAVLHDLYMPVGTDGLAGEDNLVDLEIRLLKDLGHKVIDLRRIANGLERKFYQGAVHLSGVGYFPSNSLKEVDVIHSHNLNQYTGYEWMKHLRIPIVQSFHNLRSFCPISIGWREGEHCYKCLQNPMAALKYRCGGVYGMSGSLRHIVFQSDRPQLKAPSRIIASSNMMKNLFAKIFPDEYIDVIHNPGISVNPTISNFSEKWLFAGRLVPEKGILEILKSWPDEEYLDIAGSGPLERQIERMIISRPNIQLIGTFKNSSKTIYCKYRGLVFASSWMEGSPLVVADSIANGLPVIAFGNSAVIEQIQTTRGGFHLGKEVSSNALRLGMKWIREGDIKLREICINSGNLSLSPKIWIANILDSLQQSAIAGFPE